MLVDKKKSNKSIQTGSLSNINGSFITCMDRVGISISKNSKGKESNEKTRKVIQQVEEQPYNKKSLTNNEVKNMNLSLLEIKQKEMM
jgi:hypothetical protein